LGSIPRIVSTPIKWASKRLIKRLVLSFPASEPLTVACVYCPEMCRFSCPTAVASGNDAVTPCNKMGLLYKEAKWPGRASAGGELWPVYDCTGCGRCTEFCVYQQPVAETLFRARAANAWSPAREAARALTDAEDAAGDLADELGDAAAAGRRKAAFRGLPEEPKAAHFLGRELSWEARLAGAPLGLRGLAGRRWLVHESPWLSRRMGRAPAALAWVEQARAAGAQLVLPFHHGRDCIDCGGEGAYARMFPEQARVMALEIWERDRHRADGVLCFSRRCAEHFRGAGVDAVSVPELAELA
jgi:ferredoxin